MKLEMIKKINKEIEDLFLLPLTQLSIFRIIDEQITGEKKLQKYGYYYSYYISILSLLLHQEKYEECLEVKQHIDDLNRFIKGQLQNMGYDYNNINDIIEIFEESFKIDMEKWVLEDAIRLYLIFKENVKL